MLTLPESVRIYLATGGTDMRKGFGGLSPLVEHELGECVRRPIVIAKNGAS